MNQYQSSFHFSRKDNPTAQKGYLESTPCIFMLYLEKILHWIIYQKYLNYIDNPLLTTINLDNRTITSILICVFISDSQCLRKEKEKIDTSLKKNVTPFSLNNKMYLFTHYKISILTKFWSLKVNEKVWITCHLPDDCFARHRPILIQKEKTKKKMLQLN